jgi:SOS-response transcriptional repressor LexA
VKSAFIRFLNLRQTLQIDPLELDLTSIKLLEICEVRKHSGKRLTVTEAMKLEHLASPATIHRKLTALMNEGYLTLEYEGDNRRTKYLTPTQKSDEYFSSLGSLLRKSAS